MVDENVNENPSIGIQEPPTKFRSILTKIGPGLIIAGSIVGSGELIATTSTGAEAGFTLLWLIIIGCIIKVFVQVELGRFTLVNGITSIRGLNMLQSSCKGKGNWFIWYWFVVFAFIMGQLGGIVGGVGRAMSISIPLLRKVKNLTNIARPNTPASCEHSIRLCKMTRRKQLNFKICSQILANEVASAESLKNLSYIDPDGRKFRVL